MPDPPKNEAGQLSKQRNNKLNNTVNDAKGPKEVFVNLICEFSDSFVIDK